MTDLNFTHPGEPYAHDNARFHVLMLARPCPLFGGDSLSDTAVNVELTYAFCMLLGTTVLQDVFDYPSRLCAESDRIHSLHQLVQSANAAPWSHISVLHHRKVGGGGHWVKALSRTMPDTRCILGDIRCWVCKVWQLRRPCASQRLIKVKASAVPCRRLRGSDPT